MPRRGQRLELLRAFDPTQAQGAARSRTRPPVWAPLPEDELHQELAVFVGERRTMPQPRTFANAGKSNLYKHAIAQGGVPYWAARLGVRARRGGRQRKAKEEDT